MRRPLASALVIAVAALVLSPGAGGSAGAATGTSSVQSVGISATEKSESVEKSKNVEKSKSVERVHLDDGKRKVVDERRVSVSVDTLAGLRDRQAIRVSWNGAHSTGGLVADQNSGTAAIAQEYPVVLVQCRGVDSGSVSPSQRLKPETCWTQTAFERFSNSFGTYLPPWRLDHFASKADRGRYVNAPRERPANCFGAADTERWVVFEAPGGKSYRGGPNGCAGTPPEASQVGTTNLPSNTTYAATSKGGRGSAVFNVRAATSNASLGCSERVDCSLVVIPILGVSCDIDAEGVPGKDGSDPDEVRAAADKCTAKGRYEAGENFQPNLPADPAVTGSLWWSESNWRNRISFPLDFAPSADECDITSGIGGVAAFGSELLIQATDQWSPIFCLDEDRTAVTHIQTGEPQARNLYSIGEIDAALISDVPEGTTFSRPTVKAPVASTGFAVTFAIDGGNGRALQQLRMTPRLLAKLMTLSYPSINAVRTDYAALSQNPINIASDPEFQKLNPEVNDSVGTQAAATLLSLSSDSDVIYALTSYINADPEARAWLDGKPDPWGMRVNPNYKKIALPTETWRSLDDFQPLSIYQPGVNDCLHQNPVPYLPLVAAPLTRLTYIALAMQFTLAQSQVVCSLPSFTPGSTEGAKMVALGRQTPGFRFMIGVSSLADAERYELNTASLQTHVAGSADQSMDSLSGRSFVAPSRTSLLNAVAELQPNVTTNSWDFDYERVLASSRAADAYPGSMLVYAALPTRGMEKDEASAYADWLRFVVTKGQNPGDELGELPAGYVPLTEANGMGLLRDYSLRAADAVEAQQGDVPQLQETDTPSGDPPSGTPGPPATNPGAIPGSGPVPGSDVPGGGSQDDVDNGEESAELAVESLGATPGASGGFAAYAVPVILGLALLAGIASGVVIARDRWTARRSG